MSVSAARAPEQPTSSPPAKPPELDPRFDGCGDERSDCSPGANGCEPGIPARSERRIIRNSGRARGAVAGAGRRRRAVAASSDSPSWFASEPSARARRRARGVAGPAAPLPNRARASSPTSSVSHARATAGPRAQSWLSVGRFHQVLHRSELHPGSLAHGVCDAFLGARLSKDTEGSHAIEEMILVSIDDHGIEPRHVRAARSRPVEGDAPRVV